MFARQVLSHSCSPMTLFLKYCELVAQQTWQCGFFKTELDPVILVLSVSLGGKGMP
jgi:hypothetical protein